MKKQRPRIGKPKPPLPAPTFTPVDPTPLVKEVVSTPVETVPEDKKEVSEPKVVLCDTCKWQDIPLKGKQTCREKGYSRTKCKDHIIRHPVLDQDVRAIKNDPFVFEMNQIPYNKSFQVPITNYKQELESFLIYNKQLSNGEQARKVPRHVETITHLQILEEIFEEIQAYRDRLTYIRMTVLDKKSNYDLLKVSTTSFLRQFTYYNNLKNKDEKYDVAADIFFQFYKYMEKLNDLLKLADIVADNLNNSYYITKAKFDTAKTVMERYQVLNV